MVKINNTAVPKFAELQDEICNPLIEVLGKLNLLENEIFSRSERGEDNLWGEYGARYREIIAAVCTEKQLKRFFSPSFGNPAKYGYITDCTADFIMKSAKKAELVTHFYTGVEKLNRFVLKNADGKWLVDEVYYGFESDFKNGNEKWYTDKL